MCFNDFPNFLNNWTDLKLCHVLLHLPLIHYTLTDIRNAVIQKSVLAKTTGACEGKRLENPILLMAKNTQIGLCKFHQTHERNQSPLRCLCMKHFWHFLSLDKNHCWSKAFSMNSRSLETWQKVSKTGTFPLEMKKCHKYYPLSLVQTFARNELFKLIYFVSEKVWARRKSYAIKNNSICRLRFKVPLFCMFLQLGIQNTFFCMVIDFINSLAACAIVFFLPL